MVIEIDMLIMILYGCLLVLVSYAVAALIPLTEEQGWSAVAATAITSICYVIGYCVMAHVLDYMLGMYW